MLKEHNWYFKRGARIWLGYQSFCQTQMDFEKGKSETPTTLGMLKALHVVVAKLSLELLAAYSNTQIRRLRAP